MKHPESELQPMKPYAACTGGKPLPEHTVRNQAVVRLRGLGWTLRAIAERLHISAGRVQQILKRAEKRKDGTR